MNNFFRYFKNKFKYDADEVSTVITPEELTEFYQSIINNTSLSKKHITGKEQLTGDKATEYNGQGMDYSESRLYTSNDDIRSINWKQTAKKGELIVNKYYQESNNINYILLDKRQCMYYATKTQTKLTTAIKIAMINSASLINKNRKIRIATISNKISISETIDTHDKVLSYFLSTAKYSIHESEIEKISISTLIKYIYSKKTYNSSIDIISDFHDMNMDSVKYLQALILTNDIKTYKISDPIEKSLPELFPIHYQSLSTDCHIIIKNKSELKNINNEIKSANEFIDKLLLKSGVLIKDISNQVTDENLLSQCVL